MGDPMNQAEKDSLLLATQRLHRWRMAFFGLVILLAGVAIGTSLTFILGRRSFGRRPPGPERTSIRIIRDMRRHLRLSPQQAEEIEPILKKHLETLYEIRTAVRPQIIQQLELMNDEISAILDEQQKSLWQQHLRRLQRDLQKGPGPRHRGPPPPHRPGSRDRRGHEPPPPEPMDAPH